MEPNENLLSTELQVDDITIHHLKETSRWAKFLGITFMILSIFFVIVGIVILLRPTDSYGDSSNPFTSSMGKGIIAVFYIVLGIIFFFASIYLYFFGAKMKTALQVTDQVLFNESLLNIKRYFRVIGVITIVYIGIIALALLFIIIAALFKR